MATDVERLAVLIEANTKSYERAMAKVRADTNAAMAKVERRFSESGKRLDSMFATVGRTLLGGGALVAAERLYTGFRSLVSSLGDIADAADRAGVSTEFLQAVAFPVRQAGGSFEDAARAAARFGKEIGEANVQENYLSRLLEANGVALRDQSGQLRNSTELFGEYARLVANARTVQDAQNMVAGVFGDRVGPKMLTTLQQIGTQGLPAFIAGMKEAGHVIDDSLIRKADQIDDQWNALVDRMGNKFKSFIVDTVREWETLISAFTGEASVPAVDPEGRPRIVVQARRPTTNVRTGSGSAKDDLARQIEQMRKQIAVMEAETATIDLNAGARERARVVAVLETAAKEANTAAGRRNTEVTEQQRAKINEVADAYARAAQAAEDARNPLREFAREGANVQLRMQEAAVNGLTAFEDALLDVISGTKSAKEAFADMAKSILADLIRIQIRASITGPLAAALGGGGGPLGFLGGLFGGARAAGGPVSAGRAYLVGERGPEIVVPRAAGHVIPNGGAMGARSAEMNITVRVEGAVGDKDLLERAQQGAFQAAAMAVRQYDSRLGPRLDQYNRRGL